MGLLGSTCITVYFYIDSCTVLLTFVTDSTSTSTSGIACILYGHQQVYHIIMTVAIGLHWFIVCSTPCNARPRSPNFN